MKSVSFRTARKKVSGVVQVATAGAIALGLAMSASAKDVLSVKTPQGAVIPSAKPAAKRRWYQVGVASWYGQQFQGRKTATGETFDMNDMTCAHPTLPLGTWLRVTNLKNRHTAYVRVNDRGPAFAGRIVDLSFAAARALGLKGLGTVKLEPVPLNDPAVIRGMLAQIQMPVLSQPLYR